jgi:hypothetical protein
MVLIVDLLGERSVSSTVTAIDVERLVCHLRCVQLSLCLVFCLHAARPADEREFSKLQLYEPLTSLPKNIDATHDPMIRNTPDSDEANAKGSRSAKAAGKMRTRMALLARGVQDEPRAKKAKGEGTGERDDAMDES